MSPRHFSVAVLLASVTLLAPQAGAQGPPPAPSASLMGRAEVRAAAGKDAPMPHLGGTLRRLHAAYRIDRAERAAGRVATPFAARVGMGAVRGEAVVIDAIAATEAEVPALAAALAGVGFVETGRYRHLVSGYLPLDAIEAAAAVPTLRAAHAAEASTGRLSASDHDAIRALQARVGSIEGEASVALRADNARTLFGVDGSGLTIGVLSDSYDNLAGEAAGIGSGDLPAAGVNVLDDLASGGSDEGRAMVELAFDVAPGAAFAFHTAFEGVASFAQGITDLRNAGADVIVDDVGYSGQPAFQDDIIAQSADAAFAAGVPYFSSAGNSTNAAYDGTYADSGVDALFDGGTVTGDLHDFDPGAGVDAFQEIGLTAGQAMTLAFHFDEPSALAGAGQAPTSNYDIYLVDSPLPTATVLASATDINPSTTLPFESLALASAPGTVYVAVIKVSGDDRRLAYLSFSNVAAVENAIAAAEYNGSATINGHSKAAGTFSTGAGAWFNAPTETNGLEEGVLEAFTSYGGREITLAPDGTRLGAPVFRMKPDAVASDGDNNTFFGNDSGADADTNPNFFGTSAASPNAAAVAALMIEAAGGAGSVTPTAIYDALEGTAEDLTNRDGFNPNTAAGFDNRSGNGYIRADRAVASVAATPLAVRINEIDIAQAGTDGAEFVELFGPANQALDGLVLVGVNGGDDAFYRVADLDGQALGADGLHVTCGGTVAGCDLDDTPNTDYIQNDAEAMVLALGEAFDYTNGRLAIPPAADLVDVLLHASGGSTADAPDAGLIAALGQTVTYDEGVGGDVDVDGLSRLNGAAYTGGASALFYPLPPTPGVANSEVVTVAQTDLADQAGFRFLASPMVETRTAGGVDVTDVVGGTAVGQLAAIDMVQGVAAGTTFPAEYAGSDPVLFTSYDGAAYGSPADTDQRVTPGQGFFWYWFDTVFGPVAGGTSQSRDVAAIDLSLGGVPQEADLTLPAQPETTDGFYMLGNPYPYAFTLSGLTTPAMGVLSSNFLTYDPDGNQFVTLTTADNVAALQGVFAQMTSGNGSGGTGGNPPFAFDASAIDADLRAPSGDFRGFAAVEGRVAFQLEGSSASGVRLADRAAMVRLMTDGTEAFDRHDLSKLTPPGDRVQIAPMGLRDGARHRQAVVSLPDAFRGEIPMALEATQAGRLTLSWTVTGLPDGLPVALADRMTGAVIDLRTAEAYAFDTGAVDWDDRFVLSLGDDLATAIEDADAAAFVGRVAPNPASGAASLTLRVAEAGPVRVDLIDVLGRRVAVLYDGALAASAERRLSLDAGGMAPGAYFVRVTGPGLSEVRRFSVAR